MTFQQIFTIVDKIFDLQDNPSNSRQFADGIIVGLNLAGAINDIEESNLHNYTLALYQQSVRKVK